MGRSAGAAGSLGSVGAAALPPLSSTLVAASLLRASAGVESGFDVGRLPAWAMGASGGALAGCCSLGVSGLDAACAGVSFSLAAGAGSCEACVAAGCWSVSPAALPSAVGVDSGLSAAAADGAVCAGVAGWLSAVGWSTVGVLSGVADGAAGAVV